MNLVKLLEMKVGQTDDDANRALARAHLQHYESTGSPVS
jgi:hypothetical protein